MGASVRSEVQVLFKAYGVDAVRKAVSDVGGASERAAKQSALIGSIGETGIQRFGAAARVAAGGVEAIARTGKVSGEALKSIVAQGAETALMFGAAGPIVGALGILGVAFYSAFKRARDEMVATRNKAIEEIERIGTTGDLVSAAGEQGRVFSGNEFALRKIGESDASFLGRRGGLAGVRARIAQLQKEIPEEFWKGKSADQLVGGLKPTEFADRMEELHDLLPILAELKMRYSQLEPIVDRLNAKEGERARIQTALLRDALEEKKQKASTLGYQLSASKILGQTGGQAAADVSRRALFGNERTDPINGRASVAVIKPTAGERLVEQFNTNVKQPLDAAIRGGFAQGIGDAITAAMTEAFSGAGVGGIIAAFGKSALSSLGSVFGQMGHAWISYGILAAKWVPSVTNPITAPFAAIAIGAGLVALGSALGAATSGRGSSSGGGGGGGYSSGAPQIIDRGIIDPTRRTVNAASQMTPRAPIVLQPVIIGRNDPQAHADIVGLVNAAVRKGHVLETGRSG